MKKLLAISLVLLILASGCTSKGGDSNAEEELAAALHSGKPTLVMFYATWCNPCKLEKPIIGEIQLEYGSRVNVVYVDVDRYPRLVSHYGIRGTPTMMFFDSKGRPVKTFVGYTPKPQLVATLEALMR
jgi:thioredoxin 1